MYDRRHYYTNKLQKNFMREKYAIRLKRKICNSQILRLRNKEKSFFVRTSLLDDDPLVHLLDLLESIK